MLRFAIRRVMWAVPTLFGVSLVVFLLTTLEREPEEVSTTLLARSAEQAMFLEDQQQARFLDLPLFLNTAPRDVKGRVDAYVDHIAAGDAWAEISARRLARTGGAGLRDVIRRLPGLSVEARGKVAVALAPVGERMGERDAVKLRDPAKAVDFWNGYWQDHGLDFTEPAVRRSVERLEQKASPERERELAKVDTFALPELLLAMERTTRPDVLARLSRVAARATGRAAIDEHASFREASLEVANWRAWWFVHGPDYTRYDGGTRVAAVLVDTRYARWTYGAMTGRLGLSTKDGQPIFEKLAARAPVTLALTLLALLVSYVIAIPIGVLAAWRRGHRIDVLLAFVLLTAYSLPVFWVAQILAGVFQRSGPLGLAVAVVTLALGSIAFLSRHQRAAVLEVLPQDYIRTARAKGVPRARVAVVHALRNAVVPTLTLAGVQFPAIFGGAFVVEEVFGIRGVGWETLRAIENHDAAWLVVVVLFTATITTVMLIASDVGNALLDPRMRASMEADA
jgi:ABC-type dipeptide/oligopeptide/nickel transport system permease component